MRSRLKEIIGRVAESWFSILFAFVPAPLIAFGAVLIHFKTDIAYRLLQSDAAIHAVRYFRIGLFAACVFGITLAVWILRKKKPELGKKPFTLYILAPCAGFLIYLSWTPMLLIALLIAVLLALSQLPLIPDIVLTLQRPHAGSGLLLYLQTAAAVAMLIFGVILWIQVRDRAHSHAQWIEIKSKGIYGEFHDLADLAKNPRIEFALIDDPALRFHAAQTQRFGSGDDAYSSTYALIGNDGHETDDLAEWPLWYYCGVYTCAAKTPLLVSVDLCPDPKDCHEDFASVIRGARFRIANSDTAPPFPPTLRLLSPAGDLAISERQWQRRIRFAAKLLFWGQLSYALLHAVLAALNRLLKKPTGRP